ncbi:MAG TPA: universal stress protein [Burkholderiales bacterium]|nr:universal stress protein [Betaproteobacteria bacterium]HQR54094.1 universal stress protein [Burkholderiales bacterium]
MFDRIVVPTDGSELAEKAVDRAIEYCRRVGASMTTVYVRPTNPMEEVKTLNDYGTSVIPIVTPEAIEHAERHAREMLQRVADRARDQGVECATAIVANDQPYRGIIELAEQQSGSLIFIASHGRGGMEALLLGSVTQKVLAHSKIPVLVFR